MTTYYHDPLLTADAASLAAINIRFSDLDEAIYNADSRFGRSVPATAGENLGNRSAAYIDPDDGKIYLMDADATPVRAGAIRGFVDGTTLVNNTATLVIRGRLDGFSNLTANARIYAAASAGTITQTRPSPTFGGNQIMIAPLGYAINSSTIFIAPEPISYQLRDAMADNETLSVLHHADEAGYTRKVSAYFNEPTAISEATYSSSNQDSAAALQGASGAGGTVTITATGSSNRIGDTSGVERWQSQSFLIVNAGILSQFTFELDPNSGSPTGDLTWEIRSNNAGDPGTILATGTHTPTANATNTVTVTGANRIFLSATTYWLVLRANAQASGVGYVWQAQGSSSYADGVSKFSADSGASWTANAGDCQMAITTVALTTGQKLVQTIELTSTVRVSRLGLYLRKIGLPTGTMTLRIETVNGGNPTGVLAHANATATISEASLTTSYAEYFAIFSDFFDLEPDDYALVLSTDRATSSTNYVLWGADASSPSYAGGEMKRFDGVDWLAENKDAVFTLYYPLSSLISVDYWTSSFADMVNRFGDASGDNPETEVLFKCLRDAGFSDVTLCVEVGLE